MNFDVKNAFLHRQEGMPEVQESFTMSYQTSTSTNGHHGDGDASSTNSQTMVPVDNASLISRSTSQTKTQQVCNFLQYVYMHIY